MTNALSLPMLTAPDMSVAAERDLDAVRVVRTLNDEAPAWARAGVVVVFDSTGGNSPEGECADALVTWCADLPEMERTWDAIRRMADEMSDEPAVKRLDDLSGTVYQLVVSSAPDGAEQAQIHWAPKDAPSPEGASPAA